MRIPDLENTVRAGAIYYLPGKVLAEMDDGSKSWEVVKWEQKADTTKTGTFRFHGKVSGYGQGVTLTLHIYAPFGKPVKLHEGTMLFDQGFELNMGANQIPENATVTITEAEPGTALTQAGLVLRFDFAGIELTRPVSCHMRWKRKRTQVTWESFTSGPLTVGNTYTARACLAAERSRA
ncbi:Ig-like domain-containing protein [Brevibacillus agri]|uniref:Ig-like domain-containing protein n=1 Tax=Brevibacillus agri TaxID=51101 RepID=UPI0024BF5D5A|nr:Ig-like domain-containing protein [Brevibacillus agri]MED4568959.1 Ig-like domain-containing protein [Brevibacillus agri]WHX30648.1 Ig-like domain-containing protein [Brevibacillus agri]